MVKQTVVCDISIEHQLLSEQCAHWTWLRKSLPKTWARGGVALLVTVRGIDCSLWEVWLLLWPIRKPLRHQSSCVTWVNVATFHAKCSSRLSFFKGTLSKHALYAPPLPLLYQRNQRETNFTHQTVSHFVQTSSPLSRKCSGSSARYAFQDHKK